ncbi:GNAT family N-acetyltransferase [Ornithinibacillus californiensis]|uniref:GNAT family N-acetyltransferase n=1 Tax=Ornithinibacillus californiensis TaxID=161536 RepID=UPI00064DDCB9|nr:GNAT family N-acetyltransferase [Ornithinibacillus californiensis]
MTEIKHGQNKFFVGEDESNPSAEITYQKDPSGNLVVEHTFVSDELRGQGIAGQLVEKVINHARQEGIKLIPECTYAKKYIEKHNLNDILA